MLHMSAPRQHRAILQEIARRAMIERGMLADFSEAALAELNALQASASAVGAAEGAP
ncbi:MAG: hypothetical protein H6Q86_5084, partial [candidate division NC10 bacterium]|nr:hypothetical protein [candidate division NC10 bacterium]